MQKKLVGSALAVLAMFGAGGTTPVMAQQQSRVQFEDGSASATISGTVAGTQFIDYIVTMSEAETLDVALTGGDVTFEIIPPGSSDPVHNSAIDGDEASISPTERGNYRIRVYLPAGSSRATQFSIDVSAN